MPALPATPSPPVRRTQAERRSATRARLHEAAVGCLKDRGYAATTTQAVCRRAGLSQGALFKHFPTKSALLVSAVECLYAELRSDFRREIPVAEQRTDRIRGALELLAEIFARPDVAASLELHMAARTDAQLREALSPVADEHHREILELARELFPEASGQNPRFDTYVDLVLSMLQGALIGALARPSHGAAREPSEDLLDALEWLARRQLTIEGEA